MTWTYRDNGHDFWVEYTEVFNAIPIHLVLFDKSTRFGNYTFANDDNPANQLAQDMPRWWVAA